MILWYLGCAPLKISLPGFLGSSFLRQCYSAGISGAVRPIWRANSQVWRGRPARVTGIHKAAYILFDDPACYAELGRRVAGTTPYSFWSVTLLAVSLWIYAISGILSAALPIFSRSHADSGQAEAMPTRQYGHLSRRKRQLPELSFWCEQRIAFGNSSTLRVRLQPERNWCVSSNFL